MHTSVERRTPSSTRMPVTMSVELAHDGWDETYEADAVNLSDTGIGIRGPMLPDVGQRMRCRFNFGAALGTATADARLGTCDTEGEVVWASDSGDKGEFGLRFDALEPQVSDLLARWVANLEGHESPVLPAQKAARQSVRIQLDGVASPIDAEVSVSDGRRVKVEQPLPFLLLGTRAIVEGDGHQGRRRVLRSVELKIEGSVPRLVLELESVLDSIASDVMEDESPSTVADAPLDELLEQASARSLSAADAPITPVAYPRSKKAREDDSPRAIKLEERDALLELGVQPARQDDEDDPLPFMDRLREVTDGVQKGVRPTLARLSTALRAGMTALVSSTGPRLTALSRWMARVLSEARQQLGARLPRIMARLGKEPPRRRTTSPPPDVAEARPTRSTSGGRRVTPAPEIAPATRPTVPLRMVLVAALAAVALMFGVRAMTGGAEEDPVAHAPTLTVTPDVPAALPEGTGHALDRVPSEALAGATMPATAMPGAAIAGAAPSAPLTTATPSATPEVDMPTPVLPGTLPAPRTEAGRLEAPTFPRVEDAPRAAEGSEEEAATEETLSPRPGRTHFGAAEVPHGRSTTLTMTLPITGIEGEATDSGFTVNLPGVNSLSRAAPIAAANPSVERAAILNSGDHAVLTVRFVPGRTPPYRVEARGSELVVTIGR